jgi:hypothetical protein
VFPLELFVKESSPVLFTVKPGHPDSRLALIEVDEQGRKLRYIGVMTDDGVMGDKIRGDGVYTRKISVTEKTARKARSRFCGARPSSRSWRSSGRRSKQDPTRPNSDSLRAWT